MRAISEMNTFIIQELPLPFCHTRLGIVLFWSCWRSFSRPPVVLLEQILVLLLVSCHSIALTSSSHVTPLLLVSLEIVMGDTANLLATTCVDVVSGRSGTTCAT